MGVYSKDQGANPGEFGDVGLVESISLEKGFDKLSFFLLWVSG